MSVQSIGSKAIAYQPDVVEGAMRIATTLSCAGQVYRLATGSLDGLGFETDNGNWADGLYAIDIINTAVWWKSSKRNTWQYTASNVVGTVRQLVHCVEYSGINLSTIAGAIGNIPVLGVVMPVLRSVEHALAFKHQVLVLRQKDKESIAINEVRRELRVGLSRLDKKDGEERLQQIAKQTQLLADIRKKALVTLIHNINQIALGIFAIVVVCTGGAAAVAASLPLAIYTCYVQGYGVFRFFFNLHLSLSAKRSDSSVADGSSVV